MQSLKETEDEYGEKISEFKQSYYDWAHYIQEPNVFSTHGRDGYHKRRLYRAEIYSFLRTSRQRRRGGSDCVGMHGHPKTDGSHAYHLDESILNSLAAATYTADAIRRHGAMPSLELSHSC